MEETFPSQKYAPSIARVGVLAGDRPADIDDDSAAALRTPSSRNSSLHAYHLPYRCSGGSTDRPSRIELPLRATLLPPEPDADSISV